jgi:hypothetical protein
MCARRMDEGLICATRVGIITSDLAMSMFLARSGATKVLEIGPQEDLTTAVVCAILCIP